MAREATAELARPKLLVGGVPGTRGAMRCLSAGFQPDADLDDSPLPDAVAKAWKEGLGPERIGETMRARKHRSFPDIRGDE